MPYFDSTGPQGLGPGTGWGLGPCGCGLGWQRGFGWRRFWDCLCQPKITKKEEAELLKDEAEALEEELKAIKERLAELRAKK